MAFTKLYDRKNAIVATDWLNNQVVPFFKDQGVRLLRILTDRGDARRELHFILGRQPSHVGAKRLMEKIKQELWRRKVNEDH